MENGPIKVWLSSLNGGSYTRFRLTGTLPTALPVWALRNLVDRMKFFSGSQVECVLSADLEEALWLEWWTDIFAGTSVDLQRKVRGSRSNTIYDL